MGDEMKALSYVDVDADGQPVVVIPQGVLDALGWAEGTELAVVIESGRLVLEEMRQ